jgi:predicted flap endonuclease-1-like 5' DNA nuclease
VHPANRPRASSAQAKPAAHQGDQGEESDNAKLAATGHRPRQAAARKPRRPKRHGPSGDGELRGRQEPSRGLESRAKPDDLKQISGVGPKIEGILHALGIYTFDQVAAWKKAERDWVDDYLRFKGRIEREDWVKQAKAGQGRRDRIHQGVRQEAAVRDE